MEAGGEMSVRSTSKQFPSPFLKRQRQRQKLRFRPSRNLTGTIYHCSVILRSFRTVSNSAKRDPNGVSTFSYSLHVFGIHYILSENQILVHAGYCSYKQSDSVDFQNDVIYFSLEILSVFDKIVPQIERKAVKKCLVKADITTY